MCPIFSFLQKKMWNIEQPVWPAPSLRPSESLLCLVRRFNKGKRLSFWNKWRFTWWLGDYLWVEYLLFPSYDSLLKSANDNQILGKSHTQTNIINQQPTWRQPFSFTAGSSAMKTLPMSGVRQPFSYLKIYKKSLPIFHVWPSHTNSRNPGAKRADRLSRPETTHQSLSSFSSGR